MVVSSPEGRWLPAPKGATVDKKLNGGWIGVDEYVSLYEKEKRADIKQALTDSALRHIVARAWTMPDGTTTRIYLLRFNSVAYSQGFEDNTLRPGAGGGPQMDKVGVGKFDIHLMDVIAVPDIRLNSYTEIEPDGPQLTNWTYIQSGDTLALVAQTGKGTAPVVPYHQTITIQAQLLG
jgi:hypothetical protein